MQLLRLLFCTFSRDCDALPAFFPKPSRFAIINYRSIGGLLTQADGLLSCTVMNAIMLLILTSDLNLVISLSLPI